MHHRVRLVQMFGNDSTAWRTAIAVACQERSWTYHEHWEGEAPPQTDANALIVSPAETPDPAATDWVVMSSSPEDVVEAMHGFGFSGDEATFYASKVLALGSGLALRGASVVDGQTSSINIPHLGTVVLDRLAGSRATAQRAIGLDLYRTLPLTSGATYPVDLSLISFPVYRATDTGGPRINLLGKRRTLFVTPLSFVPPGAWRVILTFALQILTPVRLRFAWGFGTDVVDVEEVITQSGRYQLSIAQYWDEIGPASFTGLLGSSCLEGKLIVEGVDMVLEPTSDQVEQDKS